MQFQNIFKKIWIVTLLSFSSNINHVNHVMVESFHVIASKTALKTLQQTKYIQGLHYAQGNLFYGTDTGKVCCISRDNQAKLEQKWTRKISSRNVQRISGNDESLLISCDSECGEVGRTVVCDLEEGNVVDCAIWGDTTAYETLTEKNEWIRVNVYGHIMSKVLHRDEAFSVKYRIPIHNMDFISAATIHKKKLYAVTMSGKLFIINLDKFDIMSWHSLHFDIPTCIHVVSHSNSNVEFLFVGNRNGMIHFAQMNEGKVTSHTQKQIRDPGSDAIVTQIGSNHHGVFISFDDSNIVGIEMLSFRELLSVNTNTPSYTNIDAFCLSPLGLFYADNEHKQIRLEIIDPRRH